MMPCTMPVGGKAHAPIICGMPAPEENLVKYPRYGVKYTLCNAHHRVLVLFRQAHP